MAILKLKYNLTPFADLASAKLGVAEKMASAQQGEIWAGEFNGGAILAFKGKNGVVSFTDAANISAEFNQALASYYTKNEIDNLFNTKLADYYTKSEVYNKEEIDAHVDDTDIHITAQERTDWNKAKADVDAFLGSAVSDQEAVIDTLKEIQDFLSTEEGGKVKEMLDKIQAAQDAADAAQDEVDALEVVVDEHKQEFETFKTTNTQAIADAQAAAEKVATDAKAAVDAYTVNGKKISENPVLVAGDLAVTPNEKLLATNVQSALEELQDEIASAVAGGVNSIVAGSAINVDATDTNNPTVSVKVDESSIVVNEDKLAVNVIDCGTYDI